jgi:hypothetical protein
VADVTVVYYTNNQEHPRFEAVTTRLLLDAVGVLPLVSVSQRPMPDLGANVCVGPVGTSYRNLYRQMLLGVKAADTEFVALAEADGLYPPGYFDRKPTGDAAVYDNLWILRWWEPTDWNRKGASDGLLFARRDVLRDKLAHRLRHFPGFGPGKIACPFRPERVQHLTGPPVVSVKTGRSINDGTARGNVRADEIPYWGSAVEWSRRLGLLPEGA